MGLTTGFLGGLFSLLFGNERNAIAETVEVFRVNAEEQSVRDARQAEAALAQFAQEFAVPRRGIFDRMIDGLNRVPRPALALGTVGLFASAMIDPIWFAARMQGIALVPEPLWWLMGAIVSFYFGARHQTKTQDFHKSIAATLARARNVTENLSALEALDTGDAAPRASGRPDDLQDLHAPRDDVPVFNAALADWRQSNERS